MKGSAVDCFPGCVQFACQLWVVVYPFYMFASQAPWILIEDRPVKAAGCVAVWFSFSTFSTCRPYHCGQVVPSCDAACPFRRRFTQGCEQWVQQKRSGTVESSEFGESCEFCTGTLQRLASWYFEHEPFQAKDRDSLTDWQRAYDNRPRQRADSWLN